MKIITIGGSGLVGSRINELLGTDHTVENLTLESGLDITKPETLVRLKEKEADWVILYAAKADVDGCERDREAGEKGGAYRINVEGAGNVANVCRDSNKKLIYISTDFVFDGEKTPPYKYKEDDEAGALNWYGMTKYKGEEVVRNSGAHFAIVRISYPYGREDFALKKDFVHAVMTRLKSGQPIRGVENHVMTPTFIDDIAFGIGAVIESGQKGIFHVTGGSSLSPYEAILLLAKRFDYDVKLVEKTTREEFFKGKAPRPFNLGMDNKKISDLGVKMRSFEEGLAEVNEI